VTIQGQETNFAQGTTQVGVGPGITPINVAVVDRTHLTAQFTVDAAAVPGSRSVTVTTGAEEAVLLNGFEIVIQSPSGPFTFTSIDPPASTSTIAYGVNTSGQVVGYYTNNTSGMHGFLMSAGAFSAIDFCDTKRHQQFRADRRIL
jgi:probable HAF family extracellular repeat protein